MEKTKARKDFKTKTQTFSSRCKSNSHSNASFLDRIIKDNLFSQKFTPGLCIRSNRHLSPCPPPPPHHVLVAFCCCDKHDAQNQHGREGLFHLTSYTSSRETKARTQDQTGVKQKHRRPLFAGLLPLTAFSHSPGPPVQHGTTSPTELVPPTPKAIKKMPPPTCSQVSLIVKSSIEGSYSRVPIVYAKLTKTSKHAPFLSLLLPIPIFTFLLRLYPRLL